MVLRIQLDEAHSCHYNKQYVVESVPFLLHFPSSVTVTVLPIC